jgi:hypothetical protein
VDHEYHMGQVSRLVELFFTNQLKL